MRVRLIYDWMGGVGKMSHGFWRRLRAAGVEVRCFNPPRLRSPFGWLIRDHRKMPAVDGRIGFVTGLCVGRMWVGDPAQGIGSAALDGVDVRLLVPGVSDLPWLRPLSRFGYRPLLEAGIRVYEWNGPMMHAKSAVADGRWARVGSSNLNIASWIGNYELDVVVEDERFARAMERMYLRDLGHATELVLESPPRGRATPVAGPGPAAEQRRRSAKTLRGTGSASRAAAGALPIGHTVKAALGNQRILAPAEARIVAVLCIALLAAAAVAVRWPLVVALPTALVIGWVGIAFLGRAYELRRERRSAGS